MYVCDVTGLHYRPVLSDVSLPRLNDRRRRLKFRLRVFFVCFVLCAFFYTKTSTWSSYLKIETSSGQWTANVLGSITSGCPGKEPALPPPPPPRRRGWTREDSFVSLSQSVTRPKIFVGHKLSRQLGLRPGMVDYVEWINGMRKNFRDN